MKISVVIPVYNSEKTIHLLVNQLFSVLERYDLEVVLVNDASKDRSEAVCTEIAERKSQVKLVSLRKNAGEHNAVICGLSFCTGDYVAIIDDDLQNPPSEIITLLNAALKGGFDVVYSRYEVKQHSILRNWLSRVNNFFATQMLSKPVDLYLSSFKVIKKDLIPEIIRYNGPYPYIDALILRSTDNIGTETVLHESRKDGKSNYTFKKLFSLYLNMVINFSSKPLRMISVAGYLISFLSFIACMVILYEKFFLQNIKADWAFLIILLFFVLGLAFVSIGLLGEYIAKIMMTVNNSPQYTVKKTVNTAAKHQSDIEISTTYDRKAV